MKNKFTLSILVAMFFSTAIMHAQEGRVGINTTNPQVTLDITAKTTDGSQAEGLLAPRLTGDQIKAADANYTPTQDGAIIYATAAASPTTTKTANITAAGYYYYDGTNAVWQKLNGTGGTTITNNMLRKAGASYTALVTSDITSMFNTLVFITSAPPSGFTLTSLAAADKGKILFVQNICNSNFSINYTDDNASAASYTIQNTRGATFVWGTNGWIRVSY